MIRQRLKGGSLSGTYYIKQDNAEFIRKEVSLVENREYGFQRWYSQLKRMQRYDTVLPGLFPKILNLGVEKDVAFFDMEFVSSGVNAQNYVFDAVSMSEVDEFYDRLRAALVPLHSRTMESFSGGFDLYVNEEVERKIKHCLSDQNFRSFCQYKTIVFNDEEVAPLTSQLDVFNKIARSSYKKSQECMVHGNLTLENILFLPTEKKVVLIDPYEENIIDSIYNEYSQLLQSSHSYYEVYNSQNAMVIGNQVTLRAQSNMGLDRFCRRLMEDIEKQCDEAEIIVIKLYEISQFTRMLPFKLAIDPSKMIFFYSLASKLFADLLKCHDL